MPQSPVVVVKRKNETTVLPSILSVPLSQKVIVFLGARGHFSLLNI